MLPSFGLPDHLGSKIYWPVYEEADRLGCAIAVHGGAHSGIGLDHMNVYAPIHALGHPAGQAIALAGMVFNGVFERFPNARFGFLEGGIGWFVMCLERFDRSHSTHMEYQLRDDDMLGPKIGDSVHEYIQRQIDNDRLFIGCEGEEPAIAFAVSQGRQQALLLLDRLPPRGHDRDLPPRAAGTPRQPPAHRRRQGSHPPQERPPLLPPGRRVVPVIPAPSRHSREGGNPEALAST